ncbi:MAG: hypothetical protein E7559_06905 [Ruminococcaceae bacterium]|nr:hypothetical protein [Oscillospiraceae bacterium]
MGAKRYNGSGWENISVHKRYTGGEWKTMDTGCRWSGSEWSPLWNAGPFQASFRLNRYGVYFDDGTRDSSTEQIGYMAVGAFESVIPRVRSTLLIYDTQEMAAQLQNVSISKAEMNVFRYGSGHSSVGEARQLGLQYSNTLSSVTATCDPNALWGDGQACVAPIMIGPERSVTMQIKPEVIEGMRDGIIKSLLFTTKGDSSDGLFMWLSPNRTYMNIVVTYTII